MFKTIIIIILIVFSFSTLSVTNNLLNNKKMQELSSRCKANIIDNDGLYDKCKKNGLLNNFTFSGLALYQKSFEEVIASIPKSIEESYDYFIFINTARPKNNPLDTENLVPSQHLLFVKKKTKGSSIFTRLDKTKTPVNVQRNKLISSSSFLKDLYISNLTPSYNVSQRFRGIRYKFTYTTDINDYYVHFKKNKFDYIQITSGDQRKYLPTVSGVFPINIKRSKIFNRISYVGRPKYLKRNVDIKAGMSNALYFAYLYGEAGTTEGITSGVAIHGTPPIAWWRLGKYQGSHGCVRIHPYVAEVLYNFVMHDIKEEFVPELDWFEPLANIKRDRRGNKIYKSTRPILIISFNGYNSQYVRKK